MFTTTRFWRVATCVAAWSIAGIESAYAQHEDHQHAQQPIAAATDVTGAVLCADGPVLPGAVLQVYKSGSTQPVASALSDQNGRFRLRVPAGDYTLRITYLGHAAYAAALTVAAGAHSLPLGSVRMQVSAVELDALVATAEQDRVQLRNGATVFDAQRAAISAGSSVADVLKHAPQVELTADGKIAIRGHDAVLVLINGRRTVLQGDALVAFLKQMPASALDKIEISTTTSAAHDAEAAAGVLDLQFRGTTSEAAAPSFSFQGSASSARQFMGSATASGNLGALGFRALYSFSALQPETWSHTMRDNLLAPSTTRTSHQESQAAAQHLLHTVMTDGSLRIADRHRAQLRLGYSWMNGAFDNLTEFADVSESGAYGNHTATASNLEHTIPTTDAALGWQYRDDEGRRLRMQSEVRGAVGREMFTGAYTNEAGLQFLATEMDYRRRELNWQNDIAFDLWNNRIEIGQHSRWRSLTADYLAIRDGESMPENFAHEQTVHAAYVSGARVLSGSFLQVGVRAEQTGTELQLGSERNRQQELALFPSLKLHWPHDTDDVVQYQLAYGATINRPGAALLNPFAMGEDDMNAFIGNPELAAERAHQVEFSVVRHGSRLTWQLTPFARVIQQPIRPLKAVSASGQSTTTWHNLSQVKAGGTDISLNGRVSDRISGSVSSTIFFEHAAAPDIDRSGVFFHVRGSLAVQLAPQTSAQLYAYRRSAQTIEQGELDAVWNSDVAVTQRVGHEGRGVLTLRLSDPFNSQRTAFRIGDQTFVQQSQRKITSRMLSLSFAWSLPQEQPDRPDEHAPRIF